MGGAGEIFWSQKLIAIAGARPHKSTKSRRTILHIGHMNQVNTVPCQGAPKINKNVDFLGSTDLDSKFGDILGIFNRLLLGAWGVRESMLCCYNKQRFLFAKIHLSMRLAQVAENRYPKFVIFDHVGSGASAENNQSILERRRNIKNISSSLQN